MGRLSRATSPLRIFTIATVLGVLTGLQAYNYVALVSEHKQPFSVLLGLNLTYWWSWALLVPGVLWLARRYRFERGTWRRAAFMHVLGVVVFTAAHVALATSARGVIMQFAERPFEWWMYFRDRFFLNFDWEMMTYWALVAFVNALDYQRQSQEREITAAQLQTQLAEAQLEALQRQLHPHFLFNTLNTIATLMHRDVHAADEMLVQLSDLLRLTLDRIGTQQVPLTDEVDFLKKYLEIERTRFGDRLIVNIDIDPEVLDAPVPNLILQPLVENSLRHGVGPRIGVGKIDVTANHADGLLTMTVRDNGVGLSPDKLHAFHSGVGLSNTRSRLENLYGDRHRFEFQTPPGGG
ncbi:MAG TPA: histidine kinase, partial [Vicinamibacterales bacterium]|nr:histidine kinase [Vicinamibacterales bacterium]